MSYPAWKKSSYSTQENCVEIACTRTGFLVRDSKVPNGPVLTLAQSPSGPPSIVRATEIMHRPKAV
nr:DUF397 domain-containing protein [Actinophytocola xanthii]